MTSMEIFHLLKRGLGWGFIMIIPLFIIEWVYAFIMPNYTGGCHGFCIGYSLYYSPIAGILASGIIKILRVYLNQDSPDEKYAFMLYTILIGVIILVTNEYIEGIFFLLVRIITGASETHPPLIR